MKKEKKEKPLDEKHSKDTLQDDKAPKKEESNKELEKIKLLEEELGKQKDEYLRVFADFENTKKRLEKEKYTALEYANEKFAGDLLSVVDSLKGAMLGIQDENDPVKKGLKLTLEQLYIAFEKYGIKEVSEKLPFDSKFHQAIQNMPSDKHKDGEIIQTLQTGFTYKERLLRPAMVVVCKNENKDNKTDKKD